MDRFNTIAINDDNNDYVSDFFDRITRPYTCRNISNTVEKSKGVSLLKFHCREICMEHCIILISFHIDLIQQG